MRLRVASAAMGVVLVGSLGTLLTQGAAGASDAERAATPVLRTSTPWVQPGDRVRLSGTAGRRAGRTVRIEQFLIGAGRGWTLENTTRTTAGGRFRYSESISSTWSRRYRACLGGRCGNTVLVRNGTKPAAEASISVTSHTGSVDAGGKIRATGKTSRNLSGRRVALQAYDSDGRKWLAIGSAKVSSKATFTVRGRVTTAGRGQKFRVRHAGSSGVKAATSKTFSATVWGWYRLYDIDNVEGSAWGQSTSINGTHYARSIEIDDYAAFNLSRKCTRFRAVVGMEDTTSSTSRYSVAIAADDAELWRLDGLMIGQAHPVDLDIRGALRLNLTETRESGDGQDTDFGDARIRCAF